MPRGRCITYAFACILAFRTGAAAAQLELHLDADRFTCFRATNAVLDGRVDVSVNGALLRRVNVQAFSRAPVVFCYLAPQSASISAVLTSTKDSAASFDPPRQPTEADLAFLTAQEALASARDLAAQKDAPKEKVLIAFRDALARWQGTDDSYRLAVAHRALADALRTQQIPREALSEYNEAVALFAGGGWQFERAVALQNLSGVQTQLGEYRPAIESATVAIGIYRDLGDRIGEAYALHARAQSWWQTGRFQTALTEYANALKAWRSLRNRDMEAQVLNALGLVNAGLGRYLTAASCYTQAGAVWQASRNGPNLRMVANNQALLLEQQGRYVAARAAFTRTLATTPTDDKHTRAYVLQNLADTWADAAQPAKAAELYRESIALKASLHDVEAEAESRRKLALCLLALKHPAEARDEASQALAMSRTISDRSGEAQSLAALAKVDSTQGATASAAAGMKDAIGLIEATRLELKGHGLRSSFFARERDFYEEAIDLALQPGGGGVREAFEWSERSRARIMLDATGRIDSHPSSARDIQLKLLAPGDVLVEYAISPRRALAFVVSPSDVRVVHLSSPAALSAESILWPLHLPANTKRLLVATEAELARVPFASLPIDSTGNSMLIDRCELAFIPSASFILARRQASSARSPNGIVVFADPIFSPADPRLTVGARPAGSPRDLTRLRFSLEEAHALQRAAGANVDLYTGAEASAANFRRAAGDPGSLLHIATHTADTTLIFSRYTVSGNPVPGDFSLDELFGLGVRRDLVVLAGCRTADGREVRGEGLRSLAQGFLFAGARAVVATLWEIDDRTSASLVKEFYEGMFYKGLSPAAALRKAQLQQRGHSRDWAAFTFSGDWLP